MDLEWDRTDGRAEVEKAHVFDGQPVGEISGVGQSRRKTHDPDLVIYGKGEVRLVRLVR